MGIKFIDDILIMAKDPQTTRTLVRMPCCSYSLRLQENLGFVISNQKCTLEQTQTLEFLGFTVNSTELELRLPSEKIKKIRTDA